MNILLFLPGIAETCTQEQITRRSKHVIVNDLAVHSMKYIKYFILRMNYDLPAPIACGFLGSIAGLIGGGCNSCFPVWVGTATGCSLGCVICVVHLLMPEPPRPQVQVRTPEPVIIQNIYITHISGEAKNIPIALPVALPVAMPLATPLAKVLEN